MTIMSRLAEAERPDRDMRMMTRPDESSPRPLMSAGDLALLLWLAAATPLSLLPGAARWRLCRLLARPAMYGARAAGARRAVGRMAGFGDDEAARIVHSLYAGRLAAQVDLLRGLLVGPDLRLDCQGLQELDAALTRGRGAVLWISDFVGAGEATKIALAKAGYRASHLSRPEHGFSKSRFGIRAINPIRVRFELRHLKERVVYDRRQPQEAIRHLAQRLAENGVVSLTASAHEGRQVAEGRLLAGRIRLAVGAPKLALMTGAPLIPVHAIRDPEEPGRFEIIFDPALTLSRKLPKGEAILAATRDYLDRLEIQLLRRPEAWGGWRRLGNLA